MSGTFVFITGGARSGKSRFAQQLAEAHSGRVAFIATAAACDDEMQQRIARHQAERPQGWSTVECTGTLAEALLKASAEHELLLVDCLGVYLTRLLPMIDAGDTLGAEAEQALHEQVRREAEEIVDAIRSTPADVIIVSNEVGSGVVPAYPSGRLFRDIVGRANQHLAQAADRAYVVIAGMALNLQALRSTDLPWGGGGC